MNISIRTVKSLVWLLLFIAFCNVCAVFFMSSDSKRGTQTADLRHILEIDSGELSESIREQRKSVTDPPKTTIPPTTRKRNGTLNNADYFSTALRPKIDLQFDCKNDTHVLALVPSLPANRELRQAIRQSWAKVSSDQARKMRTIFVMGTQAKDPNTEKSLHDEIKEHQDILLGDFVFNLKMKTTLPLLIGIKWALEKCQSFKYIYVGYDGTVVNYRQLLKRLDYCTEKGISDSRSWIGKTVSRSKVVREPTSIFYVSPDDYPDEFFPPFCTDENGYVITKLVAEELYKSALNHTVIPLADVFLGIIAKERNWTMVEDGLFTRDLFRKKVCDANAIVTMQGPKNVKELTEIWVNLSNMTVLRECLDPDLDIVLPNNVDNRQYLEKVLAYKYNHPHVCYDDAGNPRDIFMIVLISTPPEHHAVRKAIRETWCAKREVGGEKLECVFIMGRSVKETPELQNQLRHEDVKYGDLIQANFYESFQNLTLKVILGLKWITENCQHAKYFYKGDEDMFVNFENIFAYIKNLRSRGEALANFFVGSKLYSSIRYSPNIPAHKPLQRYHVPDNMYFGHFYPPYCSGGGYILSTEKVAAMYEESMRTSLINVDDAFQGILTKRVGFGPIGHSGFKNWGGKTDTCSLREKNTMTVHGIGKSADNLYSVWKRYMDSTVKNCSNTII